MLAVLCMAAAALSAQPQPVSGDTREDAEEIIVTGERVNRSLRDTPSSVTVVTGAEIESRATDRLDQLLAGMPNVQLGNGSNGPAIRGQDSTGVLAAFPAFAGGARPRATLEVDGRVVGFQEYIFGTAPLWDVHQVEVFRSPLTVDHGRNSIGGGILITTENPSYDWQGRARLIGGNLDTREASGVISGPLVDDQLAFRLAGDIRHARTTSRLGRVMRGADPNDDDCSVVRLKLLGEPASLPGFKLLTTFTRTYSQMPQVVTAVRPFRKRRDPVPGYGIFGVHVTAATVHATQEFEGGGIDTIVSAARTHARRFAEPGFGEAKSTFNDVSAEVFGHWQAAEAVTLRAGTYLAKSKLDQFIDLSQFIFSNGDFDDHQHSLGIFGEAEAEVAPRLTVAAGIRRQKDRQHRTGGVTGLFNVPIDYDATFSAWLPRLTASYAVTPSMKAGVLVQRAYNPGGTTLDFSTGGLDSFTEERLWDYEAFIKGDLQALPISVAANIFFNDFRDAQRTVNEVFITPDGQKQFLSHFDNWPKASSYGVELNLAWHPSSRLQVDGGIGYLHTHFDKTPNAEIGREFARSPHITGSASVDWSPFTRLQLSGQFQYHARYFADDFGTQNFRSIDPAATIGLRAAYSVQSFTAFLYVHNLLDSLHENDWFDDNTVSLDDPRMIGFGIDAKF